jgi:glycogen debranching enzyme
MALAGLGDVVSREGAPGAGLRRRPMTDPSLREDLRRLLLRNTRDGFSKLLGRHYCYVAPAPGTYPYQWFWDTCFHVIMLARLGEHELAKRNLQSLFTMQEDDGFVGHMVFWNQVLPRRRSDVLQARPSWQSLRPHMSALIQPCFIASALLCLFEASGDRVYLGELYAKVRRYHEWLASHRDFDGDGLLTIISPFESGMDWKATYDPVVGYAARATSRRLVASPLYWKVVAVDFANFIARYELPRIRRRAHFLVKDAGVNAIYAADLVAMEKLAHIVGDDADRFAQRRRRVVDGMLRLMYDEGERAFFDVQEPGSRKIRIATPTIFFPLALDEVPQEVVRAVVDAHFEREDQFRVPWPMPSVERRDAAFFPGETPFIWRGPTWAFNNWFLYRTLKTRGLPEHAAALRRSLWGLVERSGFREYYDPFTGQGGGARDFTWSGLLVDMD